MENSTPEILYEDNHLIAVNKPAGTLVQGDASGRIHLMDQVKSFLRKKYGKPGNIFLGLVHRLDRQVSGVVLFAKTSKAASRLSSQFRDRGAEKIYIAAVSVPPASMPVGKTGRFTELTGHIAKEDGVPELYEYETAGTTSARLEYALIAHRRPYALLLVRLHTGRKHQIRIQLSSAGMPVIGDVKYGSTVRAGDDSLLLHAHTLIVVHPTRGMPLVLRAPVPDRFNHFVPVDEQVRGTIENLIGGIVKSREAAPHDE
jgi:23S rRNA pseudouridine1911/1915/1917 synthase